MSRAIKSIIKFQPLRSFSTSSFALREYTADAQEGTFELSRKFTEGETYHPRDLNEENISRHREQIRHIKKKDLFELNEADPLREYKNTDLLSYYVTTLGKIMPASQTGLSRVNQRKLSKAIKRARAMGYIPYTYKTNAIF